MSEADFSAVLSAALAKHADRAESRQRPDDHHGGTPAAPPPDFAAQARAERVSRRVKAMAANGWERRSIEAARSKGYDEARVSGYMDALRRLDSARLGGVVVLAGNPGSGKTAATARWAITREDHAPRFLRAAEFFRSSRYTREGDEGESRDRLLKRPALVLDDAGTEFADASGSYRTDLDELVDRFYADGRILVVTTNIVWATPRQRDAAKGTADEITFSDRYGERVVDRLRECGQWVSSSARSMRGAP